MNSIAIPESQLGTPETLQAMLAADTVEILPTIISVCMLCKREIVRGRAVGQPLAPARNHSHGLCLECTPTYCRDYLNLGPEDTARILAAAEKDAA